MSRNYKIHDQDDLQYITYATVGWVDLLTRPAYKDIVLESLRHCQREKGLDLFAWCIMSNHVHLIARAKPDVRLQDILRDHKKFTSKALLKAVEENPQESRREWLLSHFQKADGGNQVWQHDLHPIWLRRPDVIQQKLRYIHRNPVEEGLVEEPHHHMYSSARDEAGLSGMLKLETIWGEVITDHHGNFEGNG
ncbi:MAG: transposase [Flavobacteriales bacterium]|nr:transposase [Flavobacteriales bacterium]